ncbi:hypothetical protein CHS0354_034834 [Potamilus streckersoni]|uniref:Galactose-3-O-sulfotransferase n=1 Tax=Potamilus streckersoni TaxID=2493646 RepID=A0AAE0TJB4_9BIVA|nr:hypothetical protein CHS0354_034834 [Potamilus streckersoni]
MLTCFGLCSLKQKLLILICLSISSLWFILQIPIYEPQFQRINSTFSSASSCRDALHSSRKDGVERTPTARQIYCSMKKNHVAFLKVHKAGSTTIMNIFIRFAIQNKLNIVLPKRTSGYGFNYIGYEDTVRLKNIVPLPYNETYDILCNHVLYEREAFQSILPKDTVNIGIIREPSSHMMSAGTYYGLYHGLLKHAAAMGLSKANIVSEFLENPFHWNVSTAFVHNRMSFDLGLERESFYNETEIERLLKTLDEDFSLIMLMEYFDESLVLMKRILCWETKDIIYVPLNTLQRGASFSLKSDDIKNLKKWNYADYRLYEHFQKVFWDKVHAEGSDFFLEVQEYKLILKQIKRYCAEVEADDTNSELEPLYISESPWSKEFQTTSHDCLVMTADELPLLRSLIRIAWKRFTSASK